MDRGDLERVLVLEVREDPRQALREQGLARARWADHEQVVATGGRDLQGLAPFDLTHHVSQVPRILLLGHRPRLRSVRGPRPRRGGLYLGRKRGVCPELDQQTGQVPS